MPGLAGIGLVSAAVLGGAFGWAGPTAYLPLTEGASAGGHTTPWVWPARPAHDRGAAICAGVVFTLGMVVITIRSAREASAHHSR